MAKTVKMCDLKAEVAAAVFVALNEEHVTMHHKEYDYTQTYLVSDVPPAKLTYPDGWYFAKRHFRNKHQSTTGFYEELPMFKDKDRKEYWEGPCTLDD